MNDQTQISCIASCSDCGAPLSDDARSKSPGDPCPNCGSLARTFATGIAESITAHDLLDIKHRDPERPSKDKLRTHVITGQEISKASGRWMDKVRVIDKNNDYYRERVADAETGEVLRDVEEPLKAHFGRGSAKPKADQ